MPETSDGTRQITCQFCGLTNDLTHAPGAPPVTTIKVDLSGATQAASSAGKAVGLIVLAVVAVVLVTVGLTIRSAFRTADTAIQQATSQFGGLSSLATNAANAANARNRKFPPSALANPPAPGWLELDVQAPASGWANFEPVTDLNWAYAIARSWQKDALLTRIDVNRLRESGTIDLTAGPDNSAGYRFTSPSQIAAWERIADRDSKATVPYELMIKMAEQKVTALSVKGEPPRGHELPPPDVDTNPVPELLTLAKKSPNFQAHPFYNGYMIHLEREGWVWYLSSLSGRDSIPRVRGRDGAVYPYRR